jgi:ribosomal protein S18 acetylase RimI-like enzyme
MKATEKPEFETRDRQRVYEYVERHGAVPPEELADKETVRIDPGRFRQIVSVLKRDGYLAEEDGLLRVALEAGAEEELTADDGTEFVVRPARQEDVSGLIGVIRQVAEDRHYIEAETVAEQLDHDDALIRHNQVDTRMFFVATVDGEVVGWIGLQAPEINKLEHTAKLTLGILGEFRGLGIGSHLLQRGLTWAQSNEYLKVHNSIPASNEDAIAFLESHGAEREAVREDHYRIDGEFVDEVMLGISLEDYA